MVYKVFVEVEARFNVEGDIVPRAIIWEDGRRFPIDKILDIRWAASLKGGGQGIRYTVKIGGKEKYLWYEDPKWFVEALGAVRK